MSRFALAGYALAILFTGISSYAAADELTPSGTGGKPIAVATTGVPPQFTVDQATRQIASVLPVSLNRAEQVVQNSFNWRGPQDASMQGEIGLGPQALVIRGEIRDDFPLVQSRERPLMPDWWKITYGADGMEVQFDDPTSSSRRLRLLLNFSSAGTAPAVEAVDSPTGLKSNPAPGSLLQLSELDPAAARQARGFSFTAVVPTERLAEPSFFASPLRITTRLHDVDGDMATYLQMQDVLEKP
jgi:hypothetical protein